MNGPLPQSDGSHQAPQDGAGGVAGSANGERAAAIVEVKDDAGAAHAGSASPRNGEGPRASTAGMESGGAASGSGGGGGVGGEQPPSAAGASSGGSVPSPMRPKDTSSSLSLLSEFLQIIGEIVDFVGVLVLFVGRLFARVIPPIHDLLEWIGGKVRGAAKGWNAHAVAISPEVRRLVAEREEAGKTQNDVHSNFIANNLLQRGVAVALLLLLVAYVFGIIDSGRDGAENIRLERLKMREELLNTFANNGARSAREMRELIVKRAELDVLRARMTAPTDEARASYAQNYDLWTAQNKTYQENVGRWRDLPSYTGLAALIRVRFQLPGVTTVAPASSGREEGAGDPSGIAAVTKLSPDERLNHLLHHYEEIFDRLTELTISSGLTEGRVNPSVAAAVESVAAFNERRHELLVISVGRTDPWFEKVEGSLHSVRDEHCWVCAQPHSIQECRAVECQAAGVREVSDCCYTALEIMYVEIIAIMGEELDRHEPLRTPIQRWIVDPFTRFVGA